MLVIALLVSVDPMAVHVVPNAAKALELASVFTSVL
jgi:hypothetical protein